jgi:hypothetical protein
MHVDDWIDELKKLAPEKVVTTLKKFCEEKLTDFDSEYDEEDDKYIQEVIVEYDDLIKNMDDWKKENEENIISWHADINRDMNTELAGKREEREEIIAQHKQDVLLKGKDDEEIISDLNDDLESELADKDEEIETLEQWINDESYEEYYNEYEPYDYHESRNEQEPNWSVTPDTMLEEWWRDHSIKDRDIKEAIISYMLEDYRQPFDNLPNPNDYE